MDHIIYRDDDTHPRNGEILGLFTCPLAYVDEQEQPDGLGLFYGTGDFGGGYNKDTQYVVGTNMCPRPEITAVIDKTEIQANDSDTATISGLPIPCTATLDGVDTIITDGVILFKIDFPGTYQIIITSFPYIPKTFEVTAI